MSRFKATSRKQAPTKDIERDAHFWIGVTYQEIIRELNKRLSPLEMTARQAEVLGILHLYPGLTQTELAEMLHIESSTLVGVIDRMEQRKWVVRKPSSRDRRKKTVHRGPNVKEVWDDIVQIGLGLRADALKGISKSDQVHLERTLSKMLANLGHDWACD